MPCPNERKHVPEGLLTQLMAELEPTRIPKLIMTNESARKLNEAMGKPFPGQPCPSCNQPIPVKIEQRYVLPFTLIENEAVPADEVWILGSDGKRYEFKI